MSRNQVHSTLSILRAAASAWWVFLLVALVPVICRAQCRSNASPCETGVPHFVKFNGTLQNVAGVSPNSVIAIRFVIYGDSTGGTPLWEEVQNTQLDSHGHYEVVLGATAPEGIPMDLFTSGAPRWLSVQPVLPGVDEQPRVLLVSVPYALEAADAQTLGGFPASAFAKATPGAEIETAIPLAGTSAAQAAPTAVPAEPSSNPSAALHSRSADIIPKFSAGSSLTNSQIKDAGGIVSLQNLANILFADRFTGGVPDAIKACPANGCIIYAVSPSVNPNLGTIDPGTKAVTIYLGPYTYAVNQVILRKALKIIGMGAAGGSRPPACTSANPCHGTTLQSINGNDPVFVLPQNDYSPATDVLLSGFRLLGSSGNSSEDAFLLDTSSATAAGLWFSQIEDIGILGFSGIGIHVRGPNTNFGSLTQWVLFNNVTVIRNPGGGNAVRLEGGVFELRFRNCEFDGAVIGDGTNIYMGGLTSTSGNRGFPLEIVFEGLVSQNAALAAQIDGGVHISFYDSHHEALWGGYQVSFNTGVTTYGVTISNCEFETTGVNQGAGYDLNIATTQAYGIVFEHNQIMTSPDAVVKGTNLSSVVYVDNLFGGASLVPPTSGITLAIPPAPTINIRGSHTVGLNPSSVPITTIQSSLGPGEMVTFFTYAGPVVFGTGGNIDLMGLSTLIVNGSITFVRNDLTGPFWTPVSQWNAPMTSSTAAQHRTAGTSLKEPR